MYLKKLEIHGFKSFAQKTVFLFDTNLTAIVGPNGSGKSNVADAIRWVLGEQSLKLLRGKKAEDVIFHGSNTSSKMGMAEVSIHFDNQDKKIPIEYSEVVISRRIYRNGESEYLLNEKKVRLADILLLLAKANFGQKSYAVIGQGMIDKILTQSAEERKEFFDEASGVKQYQIKRDQSVNKLLRTINNLEQAELLITEIGPRLKSLTRQVKKLEKREALTRELIDKQINYYGTLWQEISLKLKKSIGEQIELENKKHTNDNLLNEVQAEIDTLAEEDNRETIYNKYQQQHSSINNEINALIKEQTVLKGQLEIEQEKHGEVKLAFITNQREETKLKTKNIENQLQRLQALTQKLSTQVENKSREQESFQKEYRDLEYQLLKAREEMRDEAAALSMPEIKNRLQDLLKQQAEFFAELEKAENITEFKLLKTKAKKITTQLDKLVNELNQENKEKLAEGKTKVDSLQEKVTNYLTRKDNLVDEITNLKIEFSTQERSLLASQGELNLAQQNKAKFDEQIKDLQAAFDKKITADSRLKDFQAKFEALEKEITIRQKDLKTVTDRLEAFNQEEQRKKEIILDKQQQARELQGQINVISNQLNLVNVEKAKLETKKEDIENELREEVDKNIYQKIVKYKVEAIFNTNQLREEIIKIKKQLELIGGIDPEVQKEYQDTNERFTFLSTQVKDLNETISCLNDIVDKLDDTIKKQFNKSFKNINDHFQKYFRVLFNGGTARLKLVTEQESDEEKEKEKAEELARSGVAENTLEQTEEDIQKTEENKYKKLFQHKKKNVSGIDIVAQPANKKIRAIAGLSGGEKSMTAIALLCAIISSNPPPFIILDEVEAALDEANSEKFIAIVKEFTKHTQFILISHNRVSINNAEILYGVTMNDDGVSKVLSVKLEDIEKKKLLEKQPS